MWTKREKAMLKAIGREYFIELQNMRYYKASSKEQGDTEDLNREISRLICLGISWAAKAAVRTAREVKEPDWKGIWEELKKNSDNIIFSYGQRAYLLEIERRHGANP